MKPLAETIQQPYTFTYLNKDMSGPEDMLIQYHPDSIYYHLLHQGDKEGRYDPLDPRGGCFCDDRLVFRNETDHRYYLFNDNAHFAEYYMALPTTPSFHQVILPYAAVKLFFDLEIEAKENNGSVRKACDALIGIIPGVIQTLWPMNKWILEKGITDKDKCIICTSNGRTSKGLYKQSIHLVINSMLFEGMREVADVALKCIAKLPSEYQRCVDKAVYKKNHSMRVLGSCKKDDPTRIKRLEGCKAREYTKEQLISSLFVVGGVMSFELHDLDSVSPHLPDEEDEAVDRTAQILPGNVESYAQLFRDSKYANDFEFREMKGNFLALDRVTPSTHCEFCNRIHDKDNSLYGFAVDGKLFLKCRKAPKNVKALLIGQLSVKQMAVAEQAKADTMMAELAEIHPYQEDEYESIDRYYNKCRTIDRDEYMRIRIKYHDFHIGDSTDSTLADTFIALYGLDWVYRNDTLYHFNKVYWKPDFGQCELTKALSRDMAQVYINMIAELDRTISKTEVDDRKPLKERRKILCGIVKKLQNTASLTGVLKMLITYIRDDSIELDRCEYYFAFTNQIRDIRLNTTVNPEDVKYDYITRTTGYKYKKATAADKDDMWEILNVIFQDRPERDFYLYLLATGLCGKTLQKLILANGCGGNGKGMIHEMLQIALGEYSYTMQSATLMGVKSSGPSPEIANMHMKRLAIATEPESKQKTSLSLATVKEITGGGRYMNARQCNSNETNTRMMVTLIMECNGRPDIGGPINASETRRIIDFLFRTRFLDQDKYDTLSDEQKEDPLYVLANNRMNDRANQERLKHAFVEILATYFKQYYADGCDVDKYMPNSVKERTQEYLTENDSIACFFEDCCVKDPKSILIIKKDLFDMYREYSFSNRDVRIGKFKDDIRSSLAMSGYYKAKLQRGKRNTEQFKYSKITQDSVCSVIVGWALKTGEKNDDY
jgi:phage/plasmid-associated DNA primase